MSQAASEGRKAVRNTSEMWNSSKVRKVSQAARKGRKTVRNTSEL